MRDLIFVSMENWDEIWRRNQFICAGLTHLFPDLKILFVGLPRDVTNSLRRGDFSSLHRDSNVAKGAGYENITVLRPLKCAPNSLNVGRRLNEITMRAQIRRTAKKIGLRDPLLWLNPHSALHMAGQMGEGGMVYDITDDWTLVSSFPENQRRLIREQDQTLCRRADLVIVCSTALEKSRRAISKKILHLPNGVNPNHYRPAALPVNGSRRWTQPVFGYTGTIHPDRVDFELVVSLARAFPHGSVVMIGFDHYGAAQARLASEKNVYFTGQVPYTRVPEYMAEFDVCVVPHVESQFTESLNPIKLWEYLAVGKPIVSTNVAGFRDYAHLCRIASGSEAFIAACSAALAENGSLKEMRVAEAGRHSWDARIAELVSALEREELI
jgi:teichuronic acid biosynthesis glycosyltransferase TuaH